MFFLYIVFGEANLKMAKMGNQKTLTSHTFQNMGLNNESLGSTLNLDQ